MHPAISFYPNLAFYDGSLMNGVKDRDRPLILPKADLPNSEFPVTFFDV